jgi:hypothetical protein
VAYADPRGRRGEKRRREAGRGLIRDPYVLLVAGLVLAIPAVAAPYAALVSAPPDS